MFVVILEIHFPTLTNIQINFFQYGKPVNPHYEMCLSTNFPHLRKLQASPGICLLIYSI